MNILSPKTKSGKTLYCFSPPVMIATFAIEILGAAWTAFRYKLNWVGRFVVLILVCLGVFQLAEYLICESVGLPGLTWSKIGYVAITLLPPLGVSLAMAIAGKESTLAQALLWAACVGFVVYFLFIEKALTGQVCLGNYVIFESQGSMLLYGSYYYALLFIGVGLSLYWAKSAKEKPRKALCWLALGYAAFIIPTTAVNLVAPETISGIPSIMCGFAVLLALVLLFGVLPSAGLKRQK
jgi:hypothetical protein